MTSNATAVACAEIWNNLLIMNNTTIVRNSSTIHGVDTAGIILIVVYSILAVVCILANCLVCYVIVTRKTTDGSLKYYVFSLAITDILVGVACIPLFLSKEHISLAKWNLLESFSTGFDILLGTCSIMHLCLMAFDRAISVTKPILHRTKLRQRQTALNFLIIPWIFGIIAAVIPFTHGSKDFEYYASFVVVCLIPIPCIFIIICYTIIYLTIRKRNTRSLRRSMSLSRVNQKQMTKMLLCMIVVFIICWMPYVIYYCLPASTGETYVSTTSFWIHQTVKFLAYSNSVCNSIIYALLNPLFRDGMKDVFKRCFAIQRCYGKQSNSYDEQFQNNIACSTFSII